MPVGDCEAAFAAAAAADGVLLSRGAEPWLNQRGHLGLPPQAHEVVPLLEEIFVALGGNVPLQAAKRLIALPGDFVHLDTAR